DLVLTEGHPSRRHASVTVDGEGVWLEDLGSTNGTYLNGRRIEEKVRLAPGDRVRFDLEEFELVDPSAAAATAGPEPDPNATVLRAPPASAGADTPDPQAPEPSQPEAQPEPTPEPTPEPEAAEPAAPSGPREVEAKGGERRPGAWADPEQMNEGGTVMLDPEQLQALLSDAKPSAGPMADVDAPYLTVTSGTQAGASIKLVAGEETSVWNIGSDAERDIVFAEDGVSGFHAKILNEGNRWKVIDQMSANGTLVNEKRGSISFLSSGDRIRFGPVECIFHLPASQQNPSGGAAARAPSTAPGRGKQALIAGVAVAAAVAVAIGYWLLMT
ncbi:MAG: FHA domain-containing protein, partial [Pseudomonadota bacterium]